MLTLQYVQQILVVVVLRTLKIKIHLRVNYRIVLMVKENKIMISLQKVKKRDKLINYDEDEI